MSDTSPEQNTPENDRSIPPDAIRCISGLIYQVLKPGTGNERPGADDVVQVTYSARTETEDLFDTSGDTNAPKILSVREVIPALAEALQLMTVGEKMRVWILPHLLPDKLLAAKKETSIFDIELVSFARMKEYHSLPIELTSPRK